MPLACSAPSMPRLLHAAPLNGHTPACGILHPLAVRRPRAASQRGARRSIRGDCASSFRPRPTLQPGRLDGGTSGSTRVGPRIPACLIVVAVLWVADVRTVMESRPLMVLLNVVFTWLASACVAVLTARAFLATGRPGLLMFGCGSVLWGLTSLTAATRVDAINFTVTVHNIGVLAAALCHFVGVVSRGCVARRVRWLVTGYAAAVLASAAIPLAAANGMTPAFFVQGQGGTMARQVVLFGAVALFAGISAHLLKRFRGQRIDVSLLVWIGTGDCRHRVDRRDVAVGPRRSARLGEPPDAVPRQRLPPGGGPDVGAYADEAAVVCRSDGRDPDLLGASLSVRTGLVVALRYGLAIGLVAAATFLRELLAAWLGPGFHLYILFYPAVMVTALLAGTGPGAVATAARHSSPLAATSSRPVCSVSTRPSTALASCSSRAWVSRFARWPSSTDAHETRRFSSTATRRCARATRCCARSATTRQMPSTSRTRKAGGSWPIRPYCESLAERQTRRWGRRTSSCMPILTLAGRSSRTIAA